MNATSATVLASDFASLKDIASYEAAKKRGLSDEKAFKLGDNGRGCWGDLTAQTHTPMCALPPETMTEWWGGKAQARHQRVSVVDKATGLRCTCVVADIMPKRANITNGCGIDLNPAALVQLHLTSPIKQQVIISKI